MNATTLREENPRDHWALVTGGSRGIGAAIAISLARQGHPILLNYRRSETEAKRIQAAIEHSGTECKLLSFDVSDAIAAQNALRSVEHHPVGIIVNNAGVAQDAPFAAMDRDKWDTVTRTTLDGFYNVTQPLLMPMIRRRWGRIINISSISAIAGNRGQVNYAAAKAGLIGASRSLALEVAKKGVTVNVVAPGLIDTDMLEDVPTEMIKKLIPMQRLGRADEVAELVGFLASTRAAYITGQTFRIDGGFL